MNFNQTQRVIPFLIFLLTLCAPLSARAVPNDYELLVQRNLEFREKLNALEQKYEQLENERNVLIGHVRNLQQEKEKFLNAPRDAQAVASRDAQLQAALDQMNEKLGFVTQERDQLRKEVGGIGESNGERIKALESENAALSKKIEEVNGNIDVVMKENDRFQDELTAAADDQRESQAAIKALESERDALGGKNEEINKEIESILAGRSQSQAEVAGFKKMLETSQAAVKALESGKVVLNKQLAEISGKLAKSQSAQKELAVERAFLRAQEAELKARDRSVLAESDQLKADLQRLTEVNAALKNTEQKLQQAKQDLDASRVGSRKMEAKNRKLESKLAGMKGLKARSRKNEEGLKALQMLQKEHEAMIRKLTSEKSTLEVRLAKLEAPTGVSSTAYARRKGVLSPANQQRLDMHFNLAVTYDKTKMYKAEEREYMECLRIDPHDANVHYNLGILYDDKLKNDAKAIKHYQKYLQLRPIGEDSEQVKEWIMHAEQQQRL